MVRPVALYACGARATMKMDENRLVTFEQNDLGRVYGPKINDRIENKSRSRKTIWRKKYNWSG